MRTNSWYSIKIPNEKRFCVATTPFRIVNVSTLLFLRLLFLVPPSVNVNETLFSSWATFTYTHIHPSIGEKGVPFHPSE